MSDLERKQPQYLYKYCKPDSGLRVLEELALYLSPPAKFNDIFEVPVGANLNYSEGVGQFLDVFRYIAHGGVDMETAKTLAANASPQEWKSNYEHFVTQLRKIHKLLKLHSGITCLTTEFMDPRMWSQYADEHCGICIQFSRACGPSEILDRAKPVEYSSESIDLISSIMNEDGSTDIEMLAELLFFRKTPHWISEQEYRVVFAGIEPCCAEERSLTFKPKDIKRVFIGVNASEETRSLVEQYKQKHNADWGIYKCHADEFQARVYLEGLEVARCYEDYLFMASILSKHQ